MAALTDLFADIWHLHRRAVLAVGMVLALVLLAGAMAVVLHASGAARHPAAATRFPQPGTSSSASSPVPTASDVGEWNGIAPVKPATSSDYPPVSDRDRRDPSIYARAFAVELFTRDYRTNRADLLSWAQYEDSPLRSPNYPRADWSKVLVNSLTDLSWDKAADTPVPAEGPWLALGAQGAHQAVAQVSVTPDQRWEDAVAGGFQPSDPLATVRDVSMHVVRRASNSSEVMSFAVSLALQLGSSPRGGYGVAATNDYVVREVG